MNIIELLEQYDIHTVDDCAQHMFIADKNGKAVVIEWSKSEMTVTESPVCTNFNLSRAEGKYDGLCNRFDVITHMLADSPENDTKKAFEILKAAQVSWTQWSCVYNLDDFTVDYVIDNDFENSYHLGREQTCNSINFLQAGTFSLNGACACCLCRRWCSTWATPRSSWAWDYGSAPGG